MNCSLRRAAARARTSSTQREDHAIILALMCQSVRTKHAQGDEGLHDIASLLREGVVISFA